MFAAASGARLARKKDVKKQVSSAALEGYQANYRALQREHPFLKYDGPNIPNRYGYPTRRIHYYTSSECDTALKLSSSYIDFNGRVSKLGHSDFEGKAAWQDREHGAHELGERRDSTGVCSEAASSHRTRQKEAHRRWVKRNRIHDSSIGDCSSDEYELYGGPYGVQSAAANALLYIGLGTMCIGMIIAFVGTGEKGFKTMELRLIGPSLIGAGFLIIILRIMLCVCPSNCIRKNKNKNKLKNSTNKLNSEGGAGLNKCEDNKENVEELPLADRSTLLKEDGKKRVSIATVPTTSGDKRTYSHFENEKKLMVPSINLPNLINSSSEDGELTPVQEFDGPELDGSSFDISSTETVKNFPEKSYLDVSITSLFDLQDDKKPTVKFELPRLPKHKSNEIVLSASALADACEDD